MASEMNGRNYYSLAITIWITILCSCSSLTSAAIIGCPANQELCGNKFCYDPMTQFCSEASSIPTCISLCGQQCYNSANQICINGYVCTIGSDLCEVKYDNITGQPIEPPQMHCYDLKSQRCLNHTVCSRDRVCNGQCILGAPSYQYQLCTNDHVTLCNVSQLYYNYKLNQIQVCNSSCYDTGHPPLKHCVNDNMQCIFNCSGDCYNPSTHICINGTKCSFTENVCQTYTGSKCYNPTQNQCSNDTLCSTGSDRCSTGNCYNVSSQKCLNGTICSNNRVCGSQCINNSYKICASDQQTVCNVFNPYNTYSTNQIKVCRGVCYDSLMQECPAEPEIPCLHDPDTLICVPQNINSSTTTTSSASTAHNISHSWINTSDFSMGTSTVNSATGLTDIEKLSSSMNSPTTDNAASSSITSDLTSPLTTVTDLLAESSPYETTINDTTTFLATQTSITSVETLLGTGSHSSNGFTSPTESSSHPSPSATSIPSITSTALLKDTDATSMSSDLTTSSTFSNPSSVSNSRSSVVPTLETSGTNLDTSSGSIQTLSSSLPSSSDDMVLTTERPSQTTLTRTSEFSLHGSCGATKVCANGTSCCSPHVEYRCYQHNRTRDYGQTCRTIVIGESNNDSFVIAIAFNDKKVIIININNFLVVLLSIIITFSLLVLVPMAYFIITYRKELAVHFRVGYIFLKNHLTNSQRKQWETHPET